MWSTDYSDTRYGATIAFSTERAALRALTFNGTRYQGDTLRVRPRVFGYNKVSRVESSTPPARSPAAGRAAVIKAGCAPVTLLTEPLDEKTVRPLSIPFSPEQHTVPSVWVPYEQRDNRSARRAPGDRIPADALEPVVCTRYGMKWRAGGIVLNDDARDIAAAARWLGEHLSRKVVPDDTPWRRIEDTSRLGLPESREPPSFMEAEDVMRIRQQKNNGGYSPASLSWGPGYDGRDHTPRTKLLGPSYDIRAAFPTFTGSQGPAPHGAPPAGSFSAGFHDPSSFGVPSEAEPYAAPSGSEPFAASSHGYQFGASDQQGPYAAPSQWHSPSDSKSAFGGPSQGGPSFHQGP